MNIFQKVTIASLKKNRTRTLVTIVGILLSAALICGVTTTVVSGLQYMKKNYCYADGSWHGGVEGAEETMIQQFTSSEAVKKTAYSHYVGYAPLENKNQEKPYLYLMAAGGDFQEIMPIHLVSGTYPEKENEILLPNHLPQEEASSYQIGQELTLEIGDRFSGDRLLKQQDPYQRENGKENQQEERLKIRETKTYTVTGFYQRPDFEDVISPGYTALTVAGQTENPEGVYDIYYQLHNVKEIYHFIEEQGLPYDTNDMVLLFSGVSQEKSFYSLVYGLSAIVIALIVFGSVSLIYNAFSISVSEMTRQFGLLSSIGATKRQLRKMVFFEAFIVSLFGIPLGIFTGIGGIGLVIVLMKEKFAAFSSFPLPLTLCISPIAIVLACGIAFLTVFISAWIPSKRATKISAIEAIRQNEDIKIEKKPVKTSKITYRLFGLSGVLAAKHFKRNRKKYRTTVVSLFMSIVLFISVSSLSQYTLTVADYHSKIAGYDVEYNGFLESTAGITAPSLLSILGEAPYVTESTYLHRYILGMNLPENVLNEQWLNEAAGPYTYIEGMDSSIIHTFVAVNFVEDITYQSFLKEQGLDPKIYMDRENPMAVVIEGNKIFSTIQEKYIELNMLDKNTTEIQTEFIKDMEGYTFYEEFTDSNGNQMCRYEGNGFEEEELLIPREEAYVDFNLKIGTTLSEKPYFVENDMYTTLLYPESFLTTIMKQEKAESPIDFLFVSENHAQSYEKIKEALQQYGLPVEELYDYAGEVEQQRDLLSVIKIFSYGFIFMITLIAAANVFHTISTNIRLRRREFAMLQSIGMTAKGFRKMMYYECILYGSKALLFGLPVSFGITWLIYLVTAEGISSGFFLPLGAVVLAILGVFGLVFSTMMYSMKKIKEENIIDVLKNETLS